MSEDEDEDAPSASMVLHDEHDHRRRKAAHHEAGHLVSGWVLGGTLYEGDIIRTPEQNGQAVFTLGSGGEASPARIISLLAGPMAQRRVAPFEDDCGGQDHERVADKLDALCRHPEAAEIVLRHCRAETARLLDANWDAVEAIAAAFLEREALTGVDLADILADVVADRAIATEPRRRREWAAAVERAAAFEATFTRTA